jgi:putative flippase GtrA
MDKKETLAETLRFLAVGGFNTFLGFGLFALLQFLVGGQIGEVLVLLLAHLGASTIAFVLHRRVTFRVSGNILVDYLRFQTVFIIPIGINLVILPVLTRVVGVNVYVAQALITVMTVLISYFGHKYFSFRRKAEPST